MQTTTVTSEKAAAVKPKAIPKYRVYTLARQTLNAVERFFALPGVKEDYEKWLVEYKKKEAENV